ncbi:MAG: hypothetical protein KQA34_02915 [Candidatus Aenigmarchaeota archaeon]|nr:hypothetical protein [Candidatus Aenigmarchaeota archaeon]
MVDIETMRKYLLDEKLNADKILSNFREYGINEVEQVLLLGLDNIRLINRCSKETAEKIYTCARVAYGFNFPEPTPSNLINLEEEYVETPLVKLNKVLGNGFRVGSIIELFGSFASGKTQFLFTQSVLEASKGNYAIFIDTEKTFSVDRLKEIIINRFGEEEVDKILSRILLSTTISYSELEYTIFLLVRTLPKLIKEGKRVRLICIDSLINPYRAEFGSYGLAKLAERQQKLNWALRQLLRIAIIYKLVVLFTNQVVADPASPVNFVPSGGNVVAHASTIRIMLIKAGKNDRVLRIYDAPNIPQVEIDFKITEKGVEDK